MLVSYSILIVNNALLSQRKLQNRLMMKRLVIFAFLAIAIWAAIPQHKMDKIPGYKPDWNGTIYSGYLNTADPSRKLHYVFVQSMKGPNNKDPLTLWLNGGPGCSSLLGFLQEIGPYYLEEGKNYTDGDMLVENANSWHTVSNLLFLQSPAGVGYSVNTNGSFKYTDLSTMQDNFEALKDFFANYSEYKNNPFWIAGESYAGKYIPDLAYRIDHYNMDPTTTADKKIKLWGLFIGNGVIDFRGNSLFKSTVQYLVGHDFVDPQTLSYWNAACPRDEQSAGCQFFYSRLEETMDDINPYNIYSYCFYNDSFALGQNKQKRQFLSQQSILLSLAKSSGQSPSTSGSKFNGAPCAYFDGLFQYFNKHYVAYHAELRASEKLKWNGPCAEDISQRYLIDQSGSTFQYQYLFNRLSDIHIVLYSGDWDAVVPFVDTLNNLEKMKIRDPNLFAPIIYADQHIGFNTIMSGVNFVTVKGASHQVPQSKRPQSLYIYRTLLESFPGQPITFD